MMIFHSYVTIYQRVMNRILWFSMSWNGCSGASKAPLPVISNWQQSWHLLKKHFTWKPQKDRKTNHRTNVVGFYIFVFGCYTSITTTVLDSFVLVSGSAIHVHVAWYCTEHLLKLISSSTCNLPDYKVSIIKICRTSNLDTFQIFLSAFPSS